MDLQMKNPATGATGQGFGNDIQPLNNSTSAPPRKWRRVLAAFLTGQSYNRFESERVLSDHCLHTTVATLQRFGLIIDRNFETVPGYMGISTRVCRYRLSPASVDAAKALLGVNDEVLPC